MIPQTAAHPQTRRDIYYSIGVSKTGNLKERIAELHGSDSLAARAIPELEQFLTTPESRHARWYRAFYRKVLTGMSILYPHANAVAKAEMAQEYIDDLVHGGYPPGYNVQCMPKLDRVWPSWREEEARLRRMAERPRMPVICQSHDAGLLTPMLHKMQRVDWLVGHVMVVFDDESPVASPDIAIQSRGAAWYEQARSEGKHLVVCGCAQVDPDTRRIRITIYRPGFATRQVLMEEVYHIGLKILCCRSPHTFAALRQWYGGQLAQGGDPTFSLADMFASMMARQDTGVRTKLPFGVVRSAHKLLSPSSHVPSSVMQRVITRWSEPLPA